MSGNSINYTIIKQPEIKRPFEKSEPSLTKNLIIAIIMATILGLISVILIEMIDKNITFLSTGIYKTLFIGSIVNQTDLQCFALHLKTFLDTDPTSIGTRFLALDLDQQDLQKLDTKTNGLITESVIMNYQSASNRFQDIITNIQSGIPLVLIGKINLTNKKLFQEIEALTLKHKNLLYKVIVI